MAADTYDLLTLDEALAAVQQSTLGHEDVAELERLATAVSKQIVARCGAVVSTPVTSETHSGGQTFVRLYRRPVLSVTTVYERDATVQTTIVAEVYTSPTANDYIVDLSDGVLWRRSGGADYWWVRGRNNVLVTYAAGRCAATTSVPVQFKVAAAITLRHLWGQQKGLGSSTFGAVPGDGAMTPWALPRQALEILTDQLLPPGVA